MAVGDECRVTADTMTALIHEPNWVAVPPASVLCAVGRYGNVLLLERRLTSPAGGS